MSLVDAKAHPIPSVSLKDISLAEFKQRYVAAAQPVIVRDSMPGWRANDWGPDYFRNDARNPLVVVQYNNKGIFNAVTNDPGLSKPRRFYMRFRNAAELLYSKAGAHHSIRQASFDGALSSFASDIEHPSLLGSNSVIERNLWFGGAGCKTPLHYDNADNFLVQVKGLKKVTLFAPSQSDYLYPALDTSMPHVSRVNTFKPDFESLPRYRQAYEARLEGEIRAGDTLYMPPKWWHAVDCIETSLSVNYWWDDGSHARAPKTARDHALKFLAKGHDLYLLADWLLFRRA
jgi:tRNA wybutosine-synthesizing protein 5